MEEEIKNIVEKHLGKNQVLIDVMESFDSGFVRIVVDSKSTITLGDTANLTKKLIKSGIVEWFENCGCSPPLKHERETQYDYYFSEIITKHVDKMARIKGKSFWSYMEKNNEILNKSDI